MTPARHYAEEAEHRDWSDSGWAARTAQHLNGALAGAQLAEHLKQAWVAAGRPPMAEIGDRVGYSKATISKVLSGKMPPAWRLVRKLGDALDVPTTTVDREWHPLWIAADNYRRAIPYAGPAPAEPPPGGFACEWCGTWVVDAMLHTAWHTHLDPEPPTVEQDGSMRWAILRDALPRKEEIAHREKQARRENT
jgi:transcriptional regulator with XRE-family HTH domain